ASCPDPDVRRPLAAAPRDHLGSRRPPGSGVQHDVRRTGHDDRRHRDRGGLSMEIWINPACSKCRTAVGALDQAGAEFTQRRYLDNPPSVAEIEDVLARLDLDPWHIARMNEPIAKEIGLKSIPKDSDHR